jgi:hypothetical protein
LWNEERALPANDPEDGVEGRLLDGVSLPIVVPAQPGYLTFVVEVPRSVKDLTLDLMAPQHGLELYAKWGGLIEDFAEEGLAEASAKTLDERLRLGRNGDFPLGAGRWYVDVYNPFQDDRPAVLSLAFEASEALAFEEVPTPLQVGVPAGFSIAGPDRRHAAFVLQVPEGAEELRLQVVGAATDLDLYVRAAEPMRSWEEATWSGIAPTGHEVLVLTPSDGPGRRAPVRRRGDRLQG